MTEALSDSQKRILQTLQEEQDSLARGLSARDVNKRAFNLDTKVGPCKEQLGRLGWRGFVEKDSSDLYLITESGTEALSG